MKDEYRKGGKSTTGRGGKYEKNAQKILKGNKNLDHTHLQKNKKTEEKGGEVFEKNWKRGQDHFDGA